MTDEQTLFSDAKADDGASAPLVYLTNRENLREVLSAAAVEPRAAFDKYYRDLLEDARGRLVVLRGPVQQSLLDAVTEESPASFPVLLELDETQLDLSSVPTLNGLAWAPTGTIGLEAVKVVHFRSDRDLREHLVREYENVRVDVPVEVSEQLFGDGPVDRGQVVDWLATLQASENPSGSDLREADKRAGGLVLAAACVPEDIDLVSALAEALAGPPKRKAKAGKTAPGSAAWLFPLLSGQEAQDEGEDAIIFKAAVAAFLAADPATSSPLAIVDAIEESLKGGLGEDAESRLTRAFHALRALLRNEREFEGFRSPDSDVALQAVLAASLRPDPERFMTWNIGQLGGSADVRLAAAALVGLLHGRKRLPVSLRSKTLDELLSARAAAELATAEAAYRPDRPKLKTRKAAGDRTIEMTWNTHPVVTFEVPSATFAERISQSQSQVATAARLALCQAMGWDELIVSSIVAPAATIEIVDGVARIRLRGIPQIERDLDLEQFELRLAEADIPAAVEAEIEALLGVEPR